MHVASDVTPQSAGWEQFLCDREDKTTCVAEKGTGVLEEPASRERQESRGWTCTLDFEWPEDWTYRLGRGMHMILWQVAVVDRRGRSSSPHCRWNNVVRPNADWNNSSCDPDWRRMCTRSWLQRRKCLRHLSKCVAGDRVSKQTQLWNVYGRVDYGLNMRVWQSMCKEETRRTICVATKAGCVVLAQSRKEEQRCAEERNIAQELDISTQMSHWK